MVMSMGREPDAERGRLRTIVERVDREIAELRLSPSAGDRGGRTSDLVGSWAALVQALGLGSAPELRECPACHHLGMRAATLCGYCWTKLSPLPPPGGAA